MIKFRAQKEDGTVMVGLGLSEGNLEKLRQGLPIVVSLGEMGATNSIGHDIEVVIFYGKTDGELTELVAHKIGPDTKINPQDKYHEG